MFNGWLQGFATKIKKLNISSGTAALLWAI
jgi:hypothetical protein